MVLEALMSIKDGRKGKGEIINAYHLEARQLLPGVAKKQLNASVAIIHFKRIYIKIFISIR